MESHYPLKTLAHFLTQLHGALQGCKSPLFLSQRQPECFH